jgi:hypothetical protein
MDPLAATTAKAASTDTTTTTSSSTTAPAPTSDKKGFATLFAEAEKHLGSGEKLTKLKGHDFARITGGARDHEYVNLSGNARSGQAFERIWRDGRCFHIYGGKGTGHVVVEVGTAKKSATAGGSAATGGTAAA